MVDKTVYQLPLLFLAVTLHILVIFIICRERLHQNRYYLMKLLSIMDSIHIVCSILVFSLVRKYIRDILMLEIISSTTYSIGLASYFVIVLLTLDRYLAIKYCLRYTELVTKKKINVITSVGMGLILITMFLSMHFSEILFVKSFISTTGVMYFKMTFQTMTCVFILTFGVLVTRLRKSNIKYARKRTLSKSIDDKVSFLRASKRSVKDICVLNIWTIILTVPNIAVNLYMITTGENLRPYEGITIGIYVMSNPLVYLLTQTDLRIALRKCCNRNRRRAVVAPEENVYTISADENNKIHSPITGHHRGMRNVSAN